MSKKSIPRPKAQRCVGCAEAPPAEGAHFCAECADDASKRMGKDYLTGECAKLVWFAREWGIDVEPLLVEEIEARRVQLLTEGLAEVGGEYVRGPIPESMRRALRDAYGRWYRALRAEGLGYQKAQERVLRRAGDLFASGADLRQQASRVERRDRERTP